MTLAPALPRLVASHTVTSTALRGPRDLWVYTPAGYGAAGASYPFLFFHDGSGYLRYAGAAVILDNLIAAGVIPPLVAAFSATPCAAAGSTA